MITELQILIASALPITELRGSIPLFMATTDLNIWYIFSLAVLGNLTPVLFLLWFLPRFTDFVHKYFPDHNVIHKLVNWVYAKSHAKHSNAFYKYGSLALILIVAIPLPGTGGWTGSIIAFLFHITYWKSVFLILLGLIIAGLIVTGLSAGGIFLLT